MDNKYESDSSNLESPPQLYKIADSDESDLGEPDEQFCVRMQIGKNTSSEFKHSKTLKELTHHDEQRLIAFYEANRFLVDFNNPHYTNRDERNQKLSMLANVIGTTVGIIKRKWKALALSFRRELQREIDEQYRSRWKHYCQMQFMRAYQIEQRANFNGTSTIRNSYSSAYGNGSGSSFHAPEPVAAARANGEHNSTVISNNLSQVIATPTMEAFLKSLAPSLSLLNPQLQLKVKRGIEELVHAAKQEQYNMEEEQLRNIG